MAPIDSQRNISGRVVIGFRRNRFLDGEWLLRVFFDGDVIARVSGVGGNLFGQTMA
jgi:hypothetical protein